MFITWIQESLTKIAYNEVITWWCSSSDIFVMMDNQSSWTERSAQLMNNFAIQMMSHCIDRAVARNTR